LVEGYWSLGKRIREEYKTREDLYGKKIAQGLAESIGISERTIDYAMAAYDKYPELDKMPEGKNITWNKLITKYLPQPKNDKPIIIPENTTNVIKQGDFRELIKEIPDNSVDLVLTDPPYPKEFLPLWSDLAKESARVLKPSGFLVTYSGSLYIPEVIRKLSEHLEYYYTIALYHKGGTGQNFSVNMWDRFKPIFIYYKQPLKKQETWIENLIESPVPDKTMHEWGQSVEPFVKLLETFSQTNDTILDPFMGAGVVAEACAKTNRNFIGYEIDEKFFNIVKERYDTARDN
jgi:16S rRNA G966 N2-methylase RsmD